MDISPFVMWLGFFLASYSVVGNDVIQTLGTFLTSNEQRLKWYVLWLFAGSLLAATLIIGYMGWGNALGLGGDDISFDRLDKINIPEKLSWYFLLPPLVLMLLTRLGIPVSTTFLILTFFSFSSLGDMVHKSLMGYLIAFAVAFVMYMLISKWTERKFIDTDLGVGKKHGLWVNVKFWTVMQWSATGFLWVQWLTQDLANIYVYLGKDSMSPIEFVVSLVILVGLLGYIFYTRGGKIQEVVRSKSNTTDLRAATFIDVTYGILLLVFKQNILGLWDAKLPMSTTWVFIGLLAGREMAIGLRLDGKLDRKEIKVILMDLGKVLLGLIVSIVLVYLIKFISGH